MKKEREATMDKATMEKPVADQAGNGSRFDSGAGKRIETGNRGRVEATVAAPVHGFVAPGLEGLKDVFCGQLAVGQHFGAQLCVRKDGRVVAELWGGFADDARTRPVREDTPFMAYSATKALTAACVHRLADQGLLELEAPAARYWPAFGRHGKDGITVMQLLTHRAGIPAKASMADLVSWLWSPLAAARVAAMKPSYAPGSATVYHAFTAGTVLGELVRRVSGRSCARYLAEEFLAPLGMSSSHPGLPPRLYAKASGIYCADPGQARAAAVFSNPALRSVFLPAASLNTTALDLSLFYAMLAAGGEWEGRRYLSPEAFVRATAPRYDGPDGDSGMRCRWAAGFGLGGYSPFEDADIRHMGRSSTERTFGHSGQGGCATGWADPDSRLAFAFTCNRFLELKAAHRRLEELADSCRAVLA